MITHASAQGIGTRSHQCDAVASANNQSARAWALLDGIGSSTAVQDWTRGNARLLARIAARTGSAQAAIADVRATTDFDGHQDDRGDPPSAVAVVAVRTGNGALDVAWCGDARAYWIPRGGKLQQLTRDHNWAEEQRSRGITDFPRWHRNIVTSSLRRYDGEFGDVGTTHVRGGGRLLLCSDGVYSPFEDNGAELGPPLGGGAPHEAARALVRSALAFPAERHDNATALVADFG
ncbi:PP2C family protein-serine/threonine phosphatase [Streptomyces sp. NPDC053474]|uniref:PP2C family protein-serine/threonine phosphatase n=1 Tax=Streptomyces sp. NPDC053474 TaxID=3365704 RepID=UPI0037D87A46